jgi:hypothetical protein
VVEDLAGELVRATRARLGGTNAGNPPAASAAAAW